MKQHEVWPDTAEHVEMPFLTENPMSLHIKKTET